MSEQEQDQPEHHHTIRERLDAAHLAAEQVVAEESGQLGGEVSALAVPFEEIAAAVRAAIHPDQHVDSEGTSAEGPAGTTPPASTGGPSSVAQD